MVSISECAILIRIVPIITDSELEVAVILFVSILIHFIELECVFFLLNFKKKSRDSGFFPSWKNFNRISLR